MATRKSPGSWARADRVDGGDLLVESGCGVFEQDAVFAVGVVEAVGVLAASDDGEGGVGGDAVQLQ
ncbi:hypothetical protein [Rhodococcus sp. 21391]|uniref:hypothetical protein n=1 Tax=Rhodococcus sp. 21391 TaxID=2683591 RepID=UPI001ED8C14E|nr:hypothetical protein [Rhodococcus sp. 21391]